MASLRGKLQSEIFALSEPYPLGAQAVAFCQLVSAVAMMLQMSQEHLIDGIRNDLDKTTLPFEDRTAWKLSPVSISSKLQHDVGALLVPVPVPVMLNVLRTCIVKAAKRGVPPALIYALIRTMMSGEPFVEFDDGDEPVGGKDLNGLPAWVRGKQVSSGLAGVRSKDGRRVNDEGLTYKEWLAAAGVSISDVDNEHYEAWLQGEDPSEWRVHEHGMEIDDDLEGVRGRR